MQEFSLVDVYPVKALDYATAGDASATIKRKLKQLGIDSTILRRIAVASYEVELNLIIHSAGGTLTLKMNPTEIQLISSDVGPGIPDIQKALQEGYSTASEEARNLGFGAGMGEGAGKGGSQSQGEGEGSGSLAGAGGAAGIEPIAMIVVFKNVEGPEGVKVLTLSSNPIAQALGELGSAAMETMKGMSHKKHKKEEKKEKKESTE